MIPINISNSRRAKVWIGELPNALYDAMSTLETEVQASVNTPPSLCAAELVSYRGPHVLYGLLGTEFHPEPSARLRISVGTTNREGKVFADSLAPKYDTVRIGLPEEFANPVLEEIAKTQSEQNQLGSGLLIVRCAAYGRVTSAEFIFRMLAKVNLRLLRFQKPNILPDDILPFFKE